MSDEKILEKVRKILRKTDESSNPSEQERDTAVKMAQSILFKNGLSMADVGSVEEEDDREFVRDSDGILLEDSWEAQLCHQLAGLHFCSGYRMSTGKKGRARYIVMGRRENIAVFTEVFLYVRDQIRGMAAIETAARGNYPQRARQYVDSVMSSIHGYTLGEMEDGSEATFEKCVAEAQEHLGGLSRQAGHEDIADRCDCSVGYAVNIRTAIRKGDVAPERVRNLKVWRNSFLNGAVQRVVERVAEAQRDEVKQAVGSTGTELVTQESKLTRDFFNEQTAHLGLRSGPRSKRQVDYSGRAAGRAAGSRADISTGNKVSVGQKGLLGA